MKSTIRINKHQMRGSAVGELSYVMLNNVVQTIDERRVLFTQSYETHSAALLRFCIFKLSNRERAIDLVSDTFIRTWNYIQQGNHIVNEKSFLYTTARHLIIDEYRKKKSVSLDVLIGTGEEPRVVSNDEMYTSFEISESITCIKNLPDKYSTVLQMRYVDDLSIHDIALAIQQSENVVSVRIHRGIEKLRCMINT